MFIVAAYDIADDRRREKVASEMENFGRRVQLSVFECRLNQRELREMRTRIGRLICEGEDRVHYFRLCAKDRRRILIDGPGVLTEDSAFFLI